MSIGKNTKQATKWKAHSLRLELNFVRLLTVIRCDAAVLSFQQMEAINASDRDSSK